MSLIVLQLKLQYFELTLNLEGLKRKILVYQTIVHQNQPSTESLKAECRGQIQDFPLGGGGAPASDASAFR